ncbi:hypothetical protein BCR35DRAFT_325903 [Leucosporidium creatinivorum]|uniref:RRM domain-containing protein n=1 Tax=Leucosporidium creatinivorum TaxID=106004 RepID=A0A1Y2EW66_9BASI|nr:hypothetical protein BCR35DRAFT_325903 [Leucosporidium creatinivorum]
MQSTSMDLDNGSNSNVTRKGRGFGTGPQRPGPNRGRSLPYTKQRPVGVPDGPWKHDKSDLFEPDSSVYTPKLARAPADVSPSLRPFGSATPALTRALSDSAADRAVPQARQAAPPTGPKGLMQRLGIKGSSSEAQDRQRRDEERRARLEQQKQEKARADAARREAAARKKAEEDREVQLGIAQQEDMGFVVQVEGLVYGTSAEDVQTAFGAYGETSFCFIVNEQSAREGDALIARLTFKIYDDAVTACNKLNGAIADGRPLKVEQVSRTPIPPPIAAVLGAAPARNGGGIPTGPRADRKPVAAPVAPAPVSRTMYADEVEAVDPRLAPPIIDITGDDVDMEVDSAPKIPTGPRRGVQNQGGGRGRNARGGGGGGGGRGAPLFASAAQQQQVKSAPSLLGRLGQAPSQAGAGAGGRGQGGRGAGKGAPATGSLLARLG